MISLSSKHKNRKQGNSDAPILTESALPGTTQEMITVEQIKVGLRMIDTPGIPNMN